MALETTPETMCDWDAMVASIAATVPVWEPGTKSGYHAYTFGWITGELVRRTDPEHRPFGRWVREEICGPLGIDDIWLGIGDEQEPRVAGIIDQDSIFYAPESPLGLAIPRSLGTDKATFGRADVRRACHPGAGGIMNARSLARLYACLAGHGALGEARLVSPERVEEMQTLYTDESDAVMEVPYRRSLGYWLGGWPGSVIGPNPRAFGHPGAGGAIGWADPESGLAAAVFNNKMVVAFTPEEDQHLHIADAIRSAIG
jgi:CubicO group peptidase (beta-lactamase class C family)